MTQRHGINLKRAYLKFASKRLSMWYEPESLLLYIEDWRQKQTFDIWFYSTPTIIKNCYILIYAQEMGCANLTGAG